MTKPRLQTPKESYTFDYPEAVEASDKQISVFWPADEICVEKDIQDIRVNMTPAEAHGVVTTLRLFTLYELRAGSDYWLGRVMKEFPRPDIQRAASTFGFFELNVHAPFYNKINDALMLNTDEFYLSYVKDPTLASRIEFIDSAVSDEDLLVSLGTFSMIEGAVLYSSFAFLKHFQTNGKNKLLNVVRGVNFSARDENIHAEFGAWLHNELCKEMGVAPSERLINVASDIYDHECRIVDMIFEKGEIDGITPEQLKAFIKSRINICLENLGLSPMFEVKNDIISTWFYKNINSVQLNDFFTGVGNSYNRNWDETKFKW